ncbi:MAG: hypothetical protein F7C38_06360 [Desulfurococcales archaeon]|nr:hypothetical protein [Desulfurococcales archaeon]
MPILVALFRLATLLLVIGYVAINFLADLPLFLIAENLIYAVVYAGLLYLSATGNGYAYCLISAVAMFNAGRVSRSVVTPEGGLAELAVEHIPLLALILFVGLLALYLGLSKT